jgi:hypothetical protein
VPPQKVMFCCRVGGVLGHVAASVSPLVAKVAAIEALPSPMDVTSVKAFSGVVNYYRQFIPDCSRIQAPLNELNKKGAPWRWGQAQEEAFLTLKRALQGDPVLVLPKSTLWTKEGQALQGAV